MRSISNGGAVSQQVRHHFNDDLPVRWKDMSDITAELYWHLFGESDTVLDIGCARGAFGRHKPAGCRVVGIDIEDKALQAAKSYIYACKVNLDEGSLHLTELDLKTRDVTRLDFQDGLVKLDLLAFKHLFIVEIFTSVNCLYTGI